MVTHAGLIRRSNEDAVYYKLRDKTCSTASVDAIFTVADGMGGHAAGEVASSIATRQLRKLFKSSGCSVPAMLTRSFGQANEAIYRHGIEHAADAGLGTTCTVLVVRRGCIFLGHIGDSRAYMLRDGKLRRLTTDHTLVAELVRNGTITPEEAAASPERSVLLKALGVSPRVEPEIWSKGLPLELDDRFILCSDGLTDVVDDARISQLVQGSSPLDACELLLRAALDAGGYDNISVGVFRVLRTDENSAKPSPVALRRRRIHADPLRPYLVASRDRGYTLRQRLLQILMWAKARTKWLFGGRQ